MADKIRKYQITSLSDGLLKEIIKRQISRHFYKYLKNSNGKFYLGDKEIFNYEMVKKDDIITIVYDNNELKKDHILVDKPLNIVYEDDEYIVINKEEGLLSIPSSKEIDSIFNRLLYYFKDTNYFPHILTRLDNDTKGLVLVAKDRLSASLVAGITKKYLAITKNRLAKDEDIIDLPIKKSDDSIRRIISPDGKEAKTAYKYLKEENGKYYYDVTLLTGRTHQIRLHFAYNKAPLVGDKLYGDGIGNLGLTCYYLQFKNPITSKLIEVKLDI